MTIPCRYAVIPDYGPGLAPNPTCKEFATRFYLRISDEPQYYMEQMAFCQTHHKLFSSLHAMTYYEETTEEEFIISEVFNQ